MAENDLRERSAQDGSPHTAGTCPLCARKYELGHRDRARMERRGVEMCAECARQQQVIMFECVKCRRHFTSLDWRDPLRARDAHERDCWELMR